MSNPTYVELAAVLLALLYVVLAIREHRGCWLAAALSAVLYTWVFWQASLYMEAGLQLFYIAMAGIGWFMWGAAGDERGVRSIRRWPLSYHAAAIAGIVVAAGVAGQLLTLYTEAALPFLDSLTTVAALFTTWLVARKVLENWLYWIAIDALSIGLYTARDLHMTAALFAG